MTTSAEIANECLAQTMHLWSAATGVGAVLETPEVVAGVTGSPYTFLNKVVPRGDRCSPDAFSEAVAFARAKEVPFTAHLRVGVDDELLAVARDLRLTPAEDPAPMPGMVMDDLPQSSTSPGELDIEIAADLDALELNFSTTCVGFEMAEDVLALFVSESLLDASQSWFLTGFVDGEPVATSAGIRVGDIVGVWNVATLPAFRGRGYGAAITMLTVVEGARRGCTVASLQSSELGYSVYERLGFERVLDWTAFTG